MQNDSPETFTTKSGATGPRTAEGKANSSRNAIRTGLYAARDFIRPGEEEEYAQTLIKLMDELEPENTLEQTFATEIMGATWRLRRCRLVEETFSSIEDLNFDPMMDERTEKQQKSVDRARAQSHLILRRSLTELEKLQRARFTLEQSQEAQPDPDPAPAPEPTNAPSGLDALMALADKQLALSDLIRTESQAQTRDQWSSSFCSPIPAPPPAAGSFCNPPVGQVPDLPSSSPAATSFCKTAPEPVAQPKTAAPEPKLIPRNAPCPCRSGNKYKKCCGKDAPPVLNKAA